MFAKKGLAKGRHKHQTDGGICTKDCFNLSSIEFKMKSNMQYVVVIGLVGMILPGCMRQRRILDEYYLHNETPRHNLPSDYIKFLKTQPRFAHGELDDLPSTAIVLYAYVPEVLEQLGYDKSSFTVHRIGTSTPSFLYVIRPIGKRGFCVVHGMPGGGGVSVQTAELIALGAKRIIHIGTCAYLGDSGNSDQVLLVNGSYMDGAGILISDYEKGLVPALAYSDRSLRLALERRLNERRIKWSHAIGFTTPVYFFEASGLHKSLLVDMKWDPRPQFLEMELGAFFATAKRMRVPSASMVIPSDRYRLTNGELTHEFLDNKESRNSILSAMRAAIELTRK